METLSKNTNPVPGSTNPNPKNLHCSSDENFYLSPETSNSPDTNSETKNLSENHTCTQNNDCPSRGSSNSSESLNVDETTSDSTSSNQNVVENLCNLEPDSVRSSVRSSVRNSEPLKNLPNSSNSSFLVSSQQQQHNTQNLSAQQHVVTKSCINLNSKIIRVLSHLPPEAEKPETEAYVCMLNPNLIPAEKLNILTSKYHILEPKDIPTELQPLVELYWTKKELDKANLKINKIQTYFHSLQKHNGTNSNASGLGQSGSIQPQSPSQPQPTQSSESNSRNNEISGSFSERSHSSQSSISEISGNKTHSSDPDHNSASNKSKNSLSNSNNSSGVSSSNSRPKSAESSSPPVPESDGIPAAKRAKLSDQRGNAPVNYLSDLIKFQVKSPSANQQTIQNSVSQRPLGINDLIAQLQQQQQNLNHKQSNHVQNINNTTSTQKPVSDNTSGIAKLIAAGQKIENENVSSNSTTAEKISPHVSSTSLSTTTAASSTLHQNNPTSFIQKFTSNQDFHPSHQSCHSITTPSTAKPVPEQNVSHDFSVPLKLSSWNKHLNASSGTSSEVKNIQANQQNQSNQSTISNNVITLSSLQHNFINVRKQSNKNSSSDSSLSDQHQNLTQNCLVSGLNSSNHSILPPQFSHNSHHLNLHQNHPHQQQPAHQINLLPSISNLQNSGSRTTVKRESTSIDSDLSRATLPTFSSSLSSKSDNSLTLNGIKYEVGSNGLITTSVAEPVFKPKIFAGKDLSEAEFNKHLQNIDPSVCLQPCEQCGVQINGIEDYKSHMKKHYLDAQKKYPCEVCGKCFTTPFNLKAHMGIHTGQKPYSCRYCNKKFLRKYDMQRHEKYHICQNCGQAFADRSNLKKHQRQGTCNKADKPLSELKNSENSQTTTNTNFLQSFTQNLQNGNTISGINTSGLVSQSSINNLPTVSNLFSVSNLAAAATASSSNLPTKPQTSSLSSIPSSAVAANTTSTQNSSTPQIRPPSVNQSLQNLISPAANSWIEKFAQQQQSQQKNNLSNPGQSPVAGINTASANNFMTTSLLQTLGNIQKKENLSNHGFMIPSPKKQFTLASSQNVSLNNSLSPKAPPQPTSDNSTKIQTPNSQTQPTNTQLLVNSINLIRNNSSSNLNPHPTPTNSIISNLHLSDNLKKEANRQQSTSASAMAPAVTTTATNPSTLERPHSSSSNNEDINIDGTNSSFSGSGVSLDQIRQLAEQTNENIRKNNQNNMHDILSKELIEKLTNLKNEQSAH